MCKTALITGASRGIGRETAILFAKSGYNVIINYLNSIESNIDRYIWILREKARFINK